MPATITAVIPCFGASATLSRALASVGAQTRPPEETLLVDDGNPAGEARALEAIAARFPALNPRVVRLPENLGVGSARNAGWAEARTGLLAFLDADDAWHPRKLELQAAAMEARPEVVLCGHRLRVLGPGEALPPEPRGGGGVRPIRRWPLLVVNPFPTSTWMLRREQSIRFVEGKRHLEDHLLLMELALRDQPILGLDAELAAFFKPALSRAGLSAQLWEMEKGELDAYARLRTLRLLGRTGQAGLSALSLLKFARRLAVVRLLR